MVENNWMKSYSIRVLTKKQPPQKSTISPQKTTIHFLTFSWKIKNITFQKIKTKYEKRKNKILKKQKIKSKKNKIIGILEFQFQKYFWEKQGDFPVFKNSKFTFFTFSFFLDENRTTLLNMLSRY